MFCKKNKNKIEPWRSKPKAREEGMTSRFKNNKSDQSVCAPSRVTRLAPSCGQPQQFQGRHEGPLGANPRITSCLYGPACFPLAIYATLVRISFRQANANADDLDRPPCQVMSVPTDCDQPTAFKRCAPTALLVFMKLPPLGWSIMTCFVHRALCCTLRTHPWPDLAIV